MEGEQGSFRWLLGRLRNPLLTFVLSVVLVFDAASLPAGTIGSALLDTRRTHRCCHPDRAAVRREVNGIVVAPLDDGVVGQDAIVWAPFRPTSRGGVWAVTHEQCSTRLYVEDSVRPLNLSVQERDEVRLQFADRLEEAGAAAPQFIAALRQGEGITRTIVWSGYVHNAASLAVVLALLWSLGWVRHLGRAQRRALALAAGRCPTCGYDLRGLPGTICPECGGDAAAIDPSVAPQ